MKSLAMESQSVMHMDSNQPYDLVEQSWTPASHGLDKSMGSSQPWALASRDSLKLAMGIS